MGQEVQKAEGQTNRKKQANSCQGGHCLRPPRTSQTPCGRWGGGRGGEGAGDGRTRLPRYTAPSSPRMRGSRTESASMLLSPISIRAMWSVKNCIPEEYNGLPKVESKSIEAVHFSGPCALQSTSYGGKNVSNWHLQNLRALLKKIIQILRGGGEQGRGGRAPGEIGATGIQVPRTEAASKRFSTTESVQPCFSGARRVLLFVKLQRVCWLPAALGRHVWGGYIFFFTPVFLFKRPARERKKKICGDQSAGLGPLDWVSILGREVRALCPWAVLRGLGARGSD